MIRTVDPPVEPNQPSVDDSYDVIVLGGGPAGTTIAALIAEAGRSVLVLERRAFPRFHVGESLIPETYHTLKRLGLIEQLKGSAFPKKFSVQFVNEDGRESRPFYFDDYKDDETSQTWQVERGEFDQMLLDNAVDRNAVIRTDALVRDVLFDGDRAVGVKVQFESTEETREVSSRVVVDATGQSAFLMNRLGLKVSDARLKKGTVWSYFKGARRDSGRDEGATIILQTADKKSWFWYIPLPGDVVSVGCTGSLNYMFDESRPTAEHVFNREVERCSAIRERIEGSKRVSDYLTTRDFSYRASQGAGEGWVLIGDAFGFIDPVYSTGVFLALKSGEMAADAVVDALSAGEVSAERLGAWQPAYCEGLELFKKLVYAFYAPGFSFGQFFKQHPDLRSNMTDILIGDVFKPGVGRMFDVMGDVMPPAEEATIA